MDRILGVFALCLAVALLSAIGSAQKVAAPQPEILDAVRGSNCEFASSALDTLIQETEVNKKLIFIAYKGEDEKLDNIDIRRLHNAKTYIIEMYKRSRFARPASTVITARATDTAKEGRLDVYVEGVLRLSVHFLKNRDLDLSPCYVESGDYCENEFRKLFYPCLGRRR